MSQSEKQEDIVAVCLSHEPGHHVTMHIVTGDRQSTTAEKDKIKEFIKMTEVIINSQVDGGPEEEQNNALQQSVIRNCWTKFWQRVSAVQEIISESGATTRNSDGSYSLGKVDDLLNKWIVHCQSTGRPIDTSESISGYVKERNMTPHHAIRGCLNALLRVEAPKPPDSESMDKRLDSYERAMTFCEDLNFIDFFNVSVSEGKDEIWERQLNSEESLLIRELYRRIQAVYEYHMGSDIYKKTGGRFLRKAFDGKIGKVPFTELFRVVWVNEVFAMTKTPEYKWPASTPFGFVTNRMKGRCPIELTLSRETELKKHCSGLWEPGSTITGLRVHPEIKLAIYLKEQGIEPVQAVVGVSEPPCFSCGEYYVFMPWKIREQSQKVQDDWLGPFHMTKKGVRSLESKGYGTAAIAALAAADNVVDAFLEDVQEGDTAAGSRKRRALYSTKAESYTARVSLI